MSLPFTTEQFLDIFRQYNTSIWPMQVVLTALAVVMFAIALAVRAWSGRFVALGLAAQWTWTGIVYHWMFFARINPGARVFGALWLAGALAFAWSSFGKRRLSFRADAPWRLALGGTLIVYALVVYPILGHYGGRAYPFGPTYGAPCPVTIVTFGLLWLARPRLPRYLLAAPVIWAAIGSAAAFSLGVHEDLGLLAAGVSGVVLAFLQSPQAKAPRAGTPAAGM